MSCNDGMEISMKIAIDGPSGSGKSTLAKNLSKRLGILYLDTGAMYRVCGLYARKMNISPKSEIEVKKLLPSLDMDIQFINGEQHMYLQGENVTGDIRTPEISVAASDISAHPCVRMKMVEIQREIASKQSVVLDGREIASFVLPDAEYKFFLTADAKMRAKRRLEELENRGITEQTYEEVLADILYRDEQDSSRAFAPLIKVPEAISVDTSSNTPQETLEFVLSYIKR